MKDQIAEINPRQKQMRRSLLYVSLGLVMLLLLIILLSVRSCGAGANLEITPANDDELSTGSLSGAEVLMLKPEYFNIKINTSPVLTNGKLNLRIENSAKNTYGCRIEVLAVVSEANIIIYQSPLIKPNQSLENCTVEQSLPKGENKGVACYTYYDLYTDQIVGKSNVDLNIQVR